MTGLTMNERNCPRCGSAQVTERRRWAVGKLVKLHLLCDRCGERFAKVVPADSPDAARHGWLWRRWT